MCEIQNNIQLSEAQVKELKDEVEEQEKKYTKRGDENEVAIRESNKLLVQWEYTPPPEPTPPPPIAYPPPTQKRRFVAVDSFKPKILGMDTSFEDFIDFRKRFIIYTKACYEGVPVVDGLPTITMEEWSTILFTRVESGWS